jgi:hypothetical protein
MEELIKQAFLHVDVIGPHVHQGHYDLVGPDGEIILPQVWETMVQPDWAITMHMWPMPEPPPPPPEKMPEPMPMMMDPHFAMPPGHGGHGHGKPPKRGKSKKRDSMHAMMPGPPPPPPPPPAGAGIEMMAGPPPPPPPPPMVVNVGGPGPEIHVSRRKEKAQPSGFMRWAAGGASRSASVKAKKRSV